jgi:CDP-diacylglycerol--glycerol-3-phosphate 3-phosphatidyltransferase
MADNERQVDGGMEENLGTAANVVTLTRLVVATALFAASAYLRNPLLNLAGLAVYWLGDVADGFLARRLNQETLFGAQLDILADRMSVAFFYLNYLVLYPHLAPVIVLFLVQFMVVDHYLSNQYLRWPIMSPNYFYRVDHRIWALNWSKLGKACNTGLVTLLLLLTKSNAIVLPVVIVLLAIKLYSSLRILRLHEPIERQRGSGRGGAPASNRPS